MNEQKRLDFQQRFLQRLLDRRPQDSAHYQATLQPRLRGEGVISAVEAVKQRSLALETIVRRERPVLFVRDGKFDTDDVIALGPEATDLVGRIKTGSDALLPVLPLIGRIDVVKFPGADFLGTGWFVDTDIVVTNRHVASLIAHQDGSRFVFSRGVAGRTLESSVCNAHEFDEGDPEADRRFRVTEVLYIEPANGPNDIAFLRVDRRVNGASLPFIPIADADAASDLPVCVIGYPARAPRSVIPDQGLMNDLYQGRYDVKRAAPGFTSGMEEGATTHDCTTLGGNSGSVVIDLATGKAVGLHYAGLYQQNNFAVRASVLTEYVRGKRWSRPPEIETKIDNPVVPALPLVAAAAATAQTVTATVPGGIVSHTITFPVTVTVTLGPPQAAAAAVPAPPLQAPVRDIGHVEDAVLKFWDSRPEGVIAARVGFLDKDGTIGDVPCIAVSVTPARWREFQGKAREYEGVPVMYMPADIDEQLQSHPLVEAADSIKYDDDARTGPEFSFTAVSEHMKAILHVGPEFSWDVLKDFLQHADGRMVSAMYEFQGPHIKEAIEARLKAGGSMSLVLDNATFATVRAADTFDRVKVFEDWAKQFKFTRIVAPEGTAGLISDAYHIKVTVRDDDTFWLSSGNWKLGSSQPIITDAQRRNASDHDLPGNREWHVVMTSKTLAKRFRSHILQDFQRSKDLGSGPVSRSPADETFVDIPAVTEAMVLERRPPRGVLKPLILDRAIKVKPLLTPDREGAVYSEAVLKLINSARTSLLFQIPYIAMPSNPGADRGFIDELILALARKLKTLEDARLILRGGGGGGSKFSSPTHAAWFFKSKGVDIASRVRTIEDTHTKGMVVDGRRVLLGSHNWSKSGVTLNRDASLLFDDADVARYYAEAFEIDWARANEVTPKQFTQEGAVLEAVGTAPPPGYQRVRLSDLLSDD